jgi:hypothetical protein
VFDSESALPLPFGKPKETSGKRRNIQKSETGTELDPVACMLPVACCLPGCLSPPPPPPPPPPPLLPPPPPPPPLPVRLSVCPSVRACLSLCLSLSLCACLFALVCSPCAKAEILCVCALQAWARTSEPRRRLAREGRHDARQEPGQLRECCARRLRGVFLVLCVAECSALHLGYARNGASRPFGERKLGFPGFSDMPSTTSAPP